MLAGSWHRDRSNFPCRCAWWEMYGGWDLSWKLGMVQWTRCQDYHQRVEPSVIGGQKMARPLPYQDRMRGAAINIGIKAFLQSFRKKLSIFEVNSSSTGMALPDSALSIWKIMKKYEYDVSIKNRHGEVVCWELRMAKRGYWGIKRWLNMIEWYFFLFSFLFFL